MLDIHTFAKLFLIIGGITWGLVGVADINIIENIFTNTSLLKFIYLLIGLSAIILMFNRDYYLPFLGKTVVPFSFFKDNTIPDNSTFSVDVKVPANARVIYWASEPLKDGENGDRTVHVAYGEFKNSGIATADALGNAKLSLRLPGNYSVRKFYKKHLNAHVHYRYSLTDGMLSDIKTVQVNQDPIVKKEKFTNENNNENNNKNNNENNNENIYENIYENDVRMFDGSFANI